MMGRNMRRTYPFTVSVGVFIKYEVKDKEETQSVSQSPIVYHLRSHTTQVTSIAGDHECTEMKGE